MATQATTDAQAEKDAKEQQRLAAQATRAAAKEAKAAAKQLRAVAARAKKVASRRLKFQKSRNRAFKEAFSLRERTRWILEREAERRRPAEAVAKLASTTGISTARLHVLIFGAGSATVFQRPKTSNLRPASTRLDAEVVKGNHTS